MSTLAEALAPKSDQLNADDLIPGPRTLKITNARISKEERQTKIILNFEGDQGKPWKPCKTMGRAMVMVWAITDEQQMIGKSVRVYRDPEVKFGDQGAVGGIRISHMSHIDKPASMKLTVSQGKKAVFTFHPLVTDAPKATTTRQTPEQWAEHHIAALKAATTAEELTALRTKGTKALAKLAADRPDLYTAIITADPASGPATEDDPFGLPEVDGRSDAQHGEPSHTLHGEIDEEPHPAARAAQLIIDEFADRGPVAIDNILKAHKSDLLAMPEQFRASVYAEAERLKALQAA